jgi:hypothetical protein
MRNTVESRSKLRGVLPPEGTSWMSVSRPVLASTEKTAILSHELAVRMHLHLRARALALEILRQGGHRLHFGQGAALGIPVEQHDGAARLRKHVKPAPVGVKGHVPWVGTRSRRHKRRIVGRQRSVLHVELVDE